MRVAITLFTTRMAIGENVVVTRFLHLRRWRRHPLLAAHHVITIGVGMAAVAAVVSLMLAMAFAPLPFRDYRQLVQVWHRVESGAPIDGLSGNDLTAIQDGADGIFSAVGGYMNLILWARDEGKVTGPLRAVRMEPSAFRALDLTPVIGRPIDGDSANAGSVWIGHSLWQSRYGGRTTVIGEKIRLAWNEAGANETQAEIAGVLPPDIRIPFPSSFFDRPIDVWSVLPNDMRLRWASNRSFWVLGRLRPGRSPIEAHAALTALADRRTQPSGRRHRPVIQSFDEIAFGPARQTLGIVSVGAALVLSLAFANLASLTVAEGSRRRVELAVRMSLGASRWRIWRALVSEHATLTVCALAVGLPLAWIALPVLTRLMAAADIAPPITHTPTLNLYVMLGVAVCALSTALLWATLTVGPLEDDGNMALGSWGTLSAAARMTTADRQAKLFRLGALAIQTGVGIALMVLAVSMATAYVELTKADLGPAPERTAFFHVRRASGTVPTFAQAAEFTSQVRTRLERLPGVEATAVADSFPPSGRAASFWKPGDDPQSPRQTTAPVTVSHDYFRILGIQVLFGRGFDDTDRFGSKPAAVIDIEMARRHWASPEQAVNAQINFGARGSYEVIGVVETFGGYWSNLSAPTIYLSHEQSPAGGNFIIVRTERATPAIAEQARQVLASIPGGVDLSAARTIEDEWQATATRPRARMIGMLLLALIGMALGGQGVYALAASNVAARQQELAIRTALGASSSALMWLVLRPLLVAVMIGSGLGIASILSVPRIAPHWIASAVSDPAFPIGLAFAGLLSIAVLGGIVPARSATRSALATWLRS
jgi:predicted permease